MTDFAAIREEFPILDQQIHGHPLVYLDSAATSQKPQCVIDAEAEFYRTINAGVHRGAHELAARSTMAFEEARAKHTGQDVEKIRRDIEVDTFQIGRAHV